jgi:hypothetical protein
VKIHNIPGKLDVYWRSDVKAIVDSWTSYFVSLDEFKDAVVLKGLNHARQHGGIAWIVDSSKANGVFSREIQDFIGSDVFPAFSQIGIKYFMTINSSASALTKMTVKTYSAKTGPHGLQLVEMNSVDDCVEWLKTHN